MVRSRSRSRSPHPRKDRSSGRQRNRSNERPRDRSRDREIERSRNRDTRDRRTYHEKDRRRSRSPRPRRRRSRSPLRSDSKEKSKGGAVPELPQITEKDLEGKSEEEQEMMKMMGFGTFDSTKGKHVPGNDVSAVHLLQKRKYRQYMNRKGGFNRPLDFVA